MRLNLGARNFVVEVASNDGYLLRNFVSSGIPCLGVEPTKSTASQASKIGVKTLVDFFGFDCSERIVANHSRADLIICNNVLAHVQILEILFQALKIY